MSLIKEFQNLLCKYDIDCYVVPTSDYHQSEYISDFFKTRQYLTNFTGSAGSLVVTQDNAYLFVDGRYFVQAEKQISNEITLMKMGTPNCPPLLNFITNTMSNKKTLAFDAKLLSINFVNTILSKNQHIIIKDIDLINELWQDRPALPKSNIFVLETFFSGEEYSSKLQRIKEALQKENIKNYILTALEDQAWLYNLRGGDVLHTPVFLANTLITPTSTTLYVDKSKLSDDALKFIKHNKIIVKPYLDIYTDVSELKDKTVLDFNKVNYSLYKNINKDILVNKQDITLDFKAVKNETEIKNIKLAHIKDGVAVTKFMYFLKNNINKTTLTELSVTEVLNNYRKEQAGFVDISFNTITAYQENACMMHYSATKESNSILKPEGFLLVDSGGHYLEGTTDITRTFALGTLTDTMKLHFTTVLQSMINLSTAKFLKGIRGVNLDILARGPIWDLGIDYKCGTGHGVGYLLSVHEGPNGFRYQIVPERNDSAVFTPGMITTNEPGIYLENQYGIRIENELLCVQDEKTVHGDFLSFETITYAPIDLDAIDKELLTKKQKTWLNNYHKMVYDKLSPYLDEPVKIWLKEYTKEI